MLSGRADETDPFDSNEETLGHKVRLHELVKIYPGRSELNMWTYNKSNAKHHAALLAGALVLIAAGNALAVPVDANAPSGIAAQFATISVDGGTWSVLCTNGDVATIVFRYSAGPLEVDAWTVEPGSDLPVPLSEIAEWTPQHLQNGLYTLDTIITRDGHLWVNRSGWWNIDAEPVFPPLPCAGPVLDRGTNLGGIKALFR